jgi:2-haloacid dehalogenase
LSDTKWLTFDAYGTLIDFDLSGTIVQRLGSRLESVDTDQFLETWARDRFEEVLGEYRPYRDILRTSLKRTMQRFGLEYLDEDGDAIVEAVPTYGPFPDVPPVLEKLRNHFKLVIITNSDDDLFAGNLERLNVPIDHVITAGQARGYKPALEVFRFTFDRIGAKPEEVVHIAQGFEYDIIPAHRLGLRKIWINRRSLPGDDTYRPYDELPDLTGVPALLGVD